MTEHNKKNGLRVVRITPLCSLQDLGRVGYRAQGVTRSGAMDRYNLQVANALVGNTLNTACLEFTLAGGTFELLSHSARFAVAGEFDLYVNGEQRDVYCSHWLKAGDTIELSGANRDLRAYLALAGGFDVAPELGSCSTHLRSHLGGFANPLAVGSELALQQNMAATGAEYSLREGLRLRKRQKIRVVPGPQDDHFSEAGIASFYRESYTVSDECDRMGMRLTGKKIEHKGDGNIISDPVIAGSIQVPASGQAIILLADGPSTGGYPKIATVTSVDLAVLAQHGPRSQIQFEAISVAESQALLKKEREFFAQLPYRLDRC